MAIRALFRPGGGVDSSCVGALRVGLYTGGANVMKYRSVETKRDHAHEIGREARPIFATWAMRTL
jgi:hypothetical protein